MLNELMQMSNMIEEAGIERTLCHPLISPAPSRGHSEINSKIPKVKIFISKTGNVVKVEQMDQDSWGQLSYYYKDGHNQFPIQKIRDLVEDPENASMMDELPELNSKKATKIVKNITRIICKITEILEEKNEFTEPFFVIADRILKIDNDQEFVRDFMQKIVDLFPAKKPIDKDGKEINVITKKDVLTCMYVTFEISGFNRLNIKPLNYHETFDTLTKALINLDDKEAQKSAEGNKVDIFGEPFVTSVSLGQLALGGKEKFYPYSRNPNSPCHASYDVNGSDACPISPITKNKIIRNIQYLISEDHKGIYWNSTPNKNGTRTAFIITSSLSKEDMKEIQEAVFVPQLGGDLEEIESDSYEQAIKSATQEMIQGLKGQISYKHKYPVMILCFTLPGNGPSNILLSEELDSHRLIDCTEKWVNGWNNHDKNFIKMSKLIPTRTKITINMVKNLLNKMWNRRADGENVETSFDIIATEEVIKMFLGDEKMAHKIAHHISSSQVYLMIDVASKIMNRDVKNYKLSGARRDIFFLPVLFGQILHYLDIHKDKYTQSVPYLTGQLFASANRIQRESISSTTTQKGSNSGRKELIGSSYIHQALVNPSSAIDVLLRKMNSHLVKAKTRRDIEYKACGTNSSYFHYHPFRMAARVIMEEGIPSKWSDTDKLLVALGYFQNK